MNNSKIFKIMCGLVEAILGFPLIGGAMIIELNWLPLGIMALLHITGIIISNNNKKSISGHIVGLVFNLIGWIPFIGMIGHMITAIILLYQGFTKK